VQVAAKFDNFNNLPYLTMATLETGSKNVLALGCLNGEVRIYNLSAEANFNLICSFGAHLRMINQIVSYKDYLITCGDDCFVNVWKINTSDDNENKVSIVYNYEFSHKMPVGVSVLKDAENNTNNKNILVSFFDNTKLGLIKNLNIL